MRPWYRAYSRKRKVSFFTSSTHFSFSFILCFKYNMSPNESTVSTLNDIFKRENRVRHFPWDQEWRYRQSYIWMTQALSTESKNRSFVDFPKWKTLTKDLRQICVEKMLSQKIFSVIYRSDVTATFDVTFTRSSFPLIFFNLN